MATAENALRLLDIPDDYQFMEDELIELIKLAAKPTVDRQPQLGRFNHLPGPW